MKNIFLGLIFTLFFLPRISFGAPGDAESLAFFQQQAAERAAFIKAHPDIIAKQDQYGKEIMAWKAAQGKGLPPNQMPPYPQSTLTPQDQGTFDQLNQKQQGDRVTFFQHIAQERAAGLLK